MGGWYSSEGGVGGGGGDILGGIDEVFNNWKTKQKRCESPRAHQEQSM